MNVFNIQRVFKTMAESRVMQIYEVQLPNGTTFISVSMVIPTGTVTLAKQKLQYIERLPVGEEWILDHAEKDRS